MQLVESEAEPVAPDPPEEPEFFEPAAPRLPASPVSPESASPLVSSVLLPEEEKAGPEPPPMVPDSAVESPEWPEVELVSGFELASPVPPEVDLPVELLDEVTEMGSASISLTLWGFDSESPEAPEALVEELVEPAAPVAPVEPEVVEEPVEVSPEAAVDEEVALEDTEPVLPPAPESPEVEDGEAVAEPEEVSPVEPLPPLAATSVPSQPPS